jgi:VWFA-related protein
VASYNGHEVTEIETILRTTEMNSRVKASFLSLRTPLMGLLVLLAIMCVKGIDVAAQKVTPKGDGVPRRTGVRSVTIPVTIKLPERREGEDELKYLETFTIFEDNEPQEILATRGAPRYPLTLTVLIQDDLDSSISSEIKKLASFIRALPAGSRVMVGYLRAGSLQVKQKFTPDLERAAKALRIPVGTSILAPYNPFNQTREAIKRFESQPVGRRAVILISDGLDVSRGPDNSTPSQSLDLQRSIDEAQRRGVAVYSIFAPTAGGKSRTLEGNGQSALERLSEETGGRAFIRAVSFPVVLQPYLTDIGTLLDRQFALTYLSTHPGKGFHRIKIIADIEGGQIYHPPGYPR